MVKLDETDKKILKILQEDGRITTKILAGKIHLSNTPVYERVKKLERTGVIRNYAAIVDRAMIGKGTTVFIMATLKMHSKEIMDRFREQVLSFPEVIEFYYISGNHDVMLKIMIGDMQEYKLFVEEKLSNVENIYQFHSIFAISGDEKIAYDL